MSNSNQLIKKLEFVRKPNNKKVLRQMSKDWKNGLSGLSGTWKTLEVRRMLMRARKYVGYSDKTVDFDIANGLYKCSKAYNGRDL